MQEEYQRLQLNKASEMQEGEPSCGLENLQEEVGDLCKGEYLQEEAREIGLFVVGEELAGGGWPKQGLE